MFFKGHISLGDSYQIDGDSEMALRKENRSHSVLAELVLVLKHLGCSVIQSKKWETSPGCLKRTWQEQSLGFHLNTTPLRDY